MLFPHFYDSFAIVSIISINLLDLDTEKNCADCFFCLPCSIVCSFVYCAKSLFISSTFSAPNDNFHLFAMVPIFFGCPHIQLFHPSIILMSPMLNKRISQQCGKNDSQTEMIKWRRETMRSREEEKNTRRARIYTHSKMNWSGMVYKSTLWRHIWIFPNRTRNAYMQMIMKCAF